MIIVAFIIMNYFAAIAIQILGKCATICFGKKKKKTKSKYIYTPFKLLMNNNELIDDIKIMRITLDELGANCNEELRFRYEAKILEYYKELKYREEEKSKGSLGIHDSFVGTFSYDIRHNPE